VWARFSISVTPCYQDRIVVTRHPLRHRRHHLVSTPAALVLAAAAVVAWPQIAVVVPAVLGLAVVLGHAATRSLRHAARHIDRILDEELAPHPTPSLPVRPAEPRQRSRAA
jgi:uncharacterized membrane protein